MPTYEGLRLKFNKINRKIFYRLHALRLKNKNFTIISNNCYAGEIYEYYGLKKQSPTVGCFFMAKDYIEFISNLREYIACELIFINPKESRWYDYWKNEKKFGTYPIGKLVRNNKNEIEIFFLHYPSKKVAYEKWQRRCKRINWDNLIVKFNDQNCCTKKQVDDFLKLPFKNKLFFSVKDWGITNKDIIVIRQFINKKHILASYEPFGKNKRIDITEYINNIQNIN